MKIFSRNLKLLGCFVPLLLAGAAQADSTPTITWPETIQAAAEKNPQLSAALKTLASSKASLKQTWNGVFPSVDLNGSYTRTKGDTPASSRWNAGATASLDIFNMSRYASISGANAAVDQATASLRITASDVLLSLRSAFITLLFSQENDRVSRNIKDIRDDNARLVRLRYQSGRESKGNMMRADAEKLESDADLSQADRDIVAGQQELSHQVGWDEPRVVIATGTLDLENMALPPREVIPSLVENNPNVVLAQAQFFTANSAVRQAQSNLWPNLSASYSRDNFGPTFFPEFPTWSAAGTLNYPIFGSGPTAAFNGVSAAKRTREGAEQNLRASRMQVRSNLESTWSALAGAIDTIKVQEAFLTAARQRNDEADIRYANGLMTYDDWTVIVSDRVNFERSTIRARRDGLAALAQWNNATGQELGNQP